MLLEARRISTRVSLALLLGRLLIAVLFLYVGSPSCNRLLFQPFTPYLPGDGHDVVWPKAVELLLALPFVARLPDDGGRAPARRSRSCSRPSTRGRGGASPATPTRSPHHRRAIHYREHFVTNVATAGGLLLLQKIGAGKYTVDELMKKKDERIRPRRESTLSSVISSHLPPNSRLNGPRLPAHAGRGWAKTTCSKARNSSEARCFLKSAKAADDS